MNKHTKGPWVAAPEYGAVSANGRTVAMTDNHYQPSPGHGFPDSLDERKANCRLIGAAEELLESLQGILNCGKRDLTNPKYDGYFQTAREAVRKATA